MFGMVNQGSLGPRFNLRLIVRDRRHKGLGRYMYPMQTSKHVKVLRRSISSRS